MGVLGHGLEDLADPGGQRLDLADQDLVRLADVVHVALDLGGLERALDEAMEGEAEAQAAHQGGHARAPAAAVAPKAQPQNHQRQDMGRAESPRVDPTIVLAIRITSSKYPTQLGW